MYNPRVSKPCPKLPARCTIAAAIACLFVGIATSAHAEPVDFNRDIRPILSDKCFHCHGPDKAKQKADLRLDIREDAIAAGAIVPDDANRSELVARINAHNVPDDLMPPADSGRSLTEQQIHLLTQWIKEGAVYEKHWAFLPPEKAALPPTLHPVPEQLTATDRFVLAKLEAEQLNFSPRADRATLLRRATLDLTGLPPTITELDAFLNDPAGDEKAYTTAIDRLLDSPHYGERMAQYWVEAARYADTDGYQSEGTRNMWPWRDWVIQSFNNNMPFDQFSIEQLAGDQLPNATEQQILASGFNRNHRINNEGGALPEEYLVEYIIDRVETTSTVWLGLTTGCARCHDHKYDPVSQKEFYQLFAFFNNVPESGKDTGAKALPNMMTGSPLLAKDTTELEQQLAVAAKKRNDTLVSLPTRQTGWEHAEGADILELATANPVWSPITFSETKSNGGATLTEQEDGSLLAGGANPAKENYLLTFTADDDAPPIQSLLLEALQDPSFKTPVNFSRSTNGNFVLTEVRLERIDVNGKAQKVELSKAEADFSQTGYPITNTIDGKADTGWGASGHKGDSLRAKFTLSQALKPVPGEKLRLVLQHQTGFGQHHIGRFRVATSIQAEADLAAGFGPDPLLVGALSKPATERSEAEAKSLREFYSVRDPQLIAANAAVTKIESAISKAKGPQVQVMVMGDLPADQKRPTYLLRRGLYDQPDESEKLYPAVPASLATDAKATPSTRLEFAQWLASERNPLGARVFVNRVWQQHFGTGLVKTAEDFGAQGEWPSHPELLDWLAVDFIENGWDIKRLHRQILTSRAFTQSSRVTPALYARDPENRLLARGPRFRLDSHAIRDQALAIAGLLNDDLGGAPVKPYQPPGLWTSVASNPSQIYKNDSGPQLYRRTLYTFWKRAINPPRQIIFDAQSRDACNVRQKVTNTPLQALALMNDPTFVEAARKLAERMISEGGTTPEPRLAWAHRTATGRAADQATLTVLRENLDHFQAHYTSQPEAAAAYLGVGESSVDATIPPAELAAYAATAHLLLNLDSTITRE